MPETTAAIITSLLNHLDSAPRQQEGFADLPPATAAIYQTEARRRLADFASKTERWVKDGDSYREAMWHQLSSINPSVEIADGLSPVIAVLDARQREMSLSLEASLKELRRQSMREAKAGRHESARAINQVARETQSIFREVITEYDNYAMFMRAARAQLDPRSRGGESFSDPKELARALRKALA